MEKDTTQNPDEKKDKTTPKPDQRPNPVTVQVNGAEVKLPDRTTTGLAIKEAAIAQGVPIKATFALFEIHGQKQTPVADTDEIKVHENSRFRAVARDDNS